MATTSPPAPGRSSLLARGPQWAHLASATLQLDSMAQQLLLPGVAIATAPAAPDAAPKSAPASLRSSVDVAAVPTAAAARDQEHPPSPPPRPTSPFASMQALDDMDDTASELFTTDSLAAVVTARYGDQGTDSAGRDTAAVPDTADVLPDTAAVPDTAEVPPDADEEAGGSYQQDTQVSRVTVHWLPAAAAEEAAGLQLKQEVSGGRCGCCGARPMLDLHPNLMLPAPRLAPYCMTLHHPSAL